MADEDLVTNVKVFTDSAVKDLTKLLGITDKLQGSVEELNSEDLMKLAMQFTKLREQFQYAADESDPLGAKIKKAMFGAGIATEDLRKVLGGVDTQGKKLVTTMVALDSAMSAVRNQELPPITANAAKYQDMVNAADGILKYNGAVREAGLKALFASNEVAILNGDLKQSASAFTIGANTAKALNNQLKAMADESAKASSGATSAFDKVSSQKGFVASGAPKKALKDMSSDLPRIQQLADSIAKDFENGMVESARTSKAELDKLVASFNANLLKVQASIDATKERFKGFNTEAKVAAKQAYNSIREVERLTSRYGTDELKGILDQMRAKKAELDAAVVKLSVATTKGQPVVASRTADEIAQMVSQFSKQTAAAREAARAVDELKAEEARLKAESEANSAALSAFASTLTTIYSGLTKSASGVADFISKLASITPVVGSVQRGLASFLSVLNRIVPGLENVTGATNKAGQSFFQFRAKLFTVLSIGAMVTAMLNNMFTSMSDAIEGIHKYNVAFGDAANQTQDWNLVTVDANGIITSVEQKTTTLADKLQILADSWDTNVLEMQNGIATFKAMADAMGFPQQEASQLAENFTYLAQDIASLYDVPIETATQKLQSALAGQTRAIRSFGADITEGTLVNFANQEMGMDIKSLDGLDRHSKAILYNNAIISQLTGNTKEATAAMVGMNNVERQSGNAAADWAKSMNTPANMMRSLKQQLLTTAQDVGALFIPALSAIIPVANAVARAVSAAAAAIANFFGASLGALRDQFVSLMPKSTAEDMASGIDDVGSSLDSAGGSAGSAAKQAKEFQKQLLGFDEINNITPEDDSSSGGGGGGGGGAGGGAASIGDLWKYDPTAGAKSKADEIFDALSNALKTEGWYGVGKYIGSSLQQGLAGIDWAKIRGAFYQGGQGLAQMLNGFFEVPNLANTIGNTIGNTINTGLNLALGFVRNFNFASFGTFIGSSFSAMYNTINWGSIAEIVSSGVNGVMETVRTAVSSASLGDLGGRIGGTITKIFTGIDWPGVGNTLATSLSGVFQFAANALKSIDFGEMASGVSSMIANAFINTDWASLGYTIGQAAGGLAKTIVDVVFNPATWFGLLKGAGETIMGFVSGLFDSGGAFDFLSLITMPFAGASAALRGLAGPIGKAIEPIATKISEVLGVFGKSSPAVDAFAGPLQNLGKIFTNDIAPAVGNAITQFGKFAGETLTTLGNAVGPVAETIGSKLAPLVQKFVSEFLPSLFTLIGKVAGVISGVLSKVLPVIQGILQTVAPIISTIAKVIAGILLTGLTMAVSAGTAFADTLSNAGDVAGGVFEAVGGFITGLWEGITSIFGGIGKWFGDRFNDILNAVKSIPGKIQGFFKSAYDKATGVFQFISTWFRVKVVAKIIHVVGTLPARIKKFFKNAYTGATKAFQGIGSFFKRVATKVVNGVKSIPKRMGDIFTKAYEKITGIFSGIGDWFKTNVMDKITGAGKEANKQVKQVKSSGSGGKNTSSGENGLYPLTTRANGGYVNTGQLFVAREAGPEMVGRINNRTAVANNDQIVSAVSQGVARAVSAVMSTDRKSGGGDKNITISLNLDGRQIIRSINSAQRVAGRTLLEV